MPLPWPLQAVQGKVPLSISIGIPASAPLHRAVAINPGLDGHGKASTTPGDGFARPIGLRPQAKPATGGFAAMLWAAKPKLLVRHGRANGLWLGTTRDQHQWGRGPWGCGPIGGPIRRSLDHANWQPAQLPGENAPIAYWASASRAPAPGPKVKPLCPATGPRLSGLHRRSNF